MEAASLPHHQGYRVDPWTEKFLFKHNTRSLATFGIKSPPIRPGTASTRQGRCHRRPSAELAPNEPGFLREAPIASGHRAAIYVYPPKCRGRAGAIRRRSSVRQERARARVPRGPDPCTGRAQAGGPRSRKGPRGARRLRCPEAAAIGNRERDRSTGGWRRRARGRTAAIAHSRS